MSTYPLRSEFAYPDRSYQFDRCRTSTPWSRELAPNRQQRATSGGPRLDASPPGAPSPLQTSGFVAPERSQLATDDVDLSQSLPSKFDLSLEHVDISTYR